VRAATQLTNLRIRLQGTVMAAAANRRLMMMRGG